MFDDQIDAHPLLSRCAKIELTNQGLAKIFAEHCQQIATKENLNGKPLQSYIKLAQIPLLEPNCQFNLTASIAKLHTDQYGNDVKGRGIFFENIEEPMAKSLCQYISKY